MTTAIDADTTADRSRTGDAPRRRGARKRRAGLIVAIVAYLVYLLRAQLDSERKAEPRSA